MLNVHSGDDDGLMGLCAAMESAFFFLENNSFFPCALHYEYNDSTVMHFN